MYRTLIRECILGFLFWNLFQGLPALIWFFPMNELEFSGYEAFSLVWLMPLVLNSSKATKFLDNAKGKACLRLLLLVSFLSFHAPTTISRLIILAMGNGAALTLLVLTLWSRSSYQRSLTFWGLLMGLVAFLTGRVWYTTMMPAWWSTASNALVIVMGTAATADKITSGDDDMKRDEEKPTVIIRKSSWLIISLGFGSLINLTHTCFGDVSIIPRWSVTSYPWTGPLPYPWGAIVLMSVVIGIVLIPSTLGRNPVWWLFGLISFSVLYLFHGWTSFIAGNLLGVYTMSIWPEMIDRVSACPPVKTIVVAILFYLAELFLMVWTVAYNFVPGGVYTREHTGYLITFLMVTIGLALVYVKKHEHRSNVAYAETKIGHLAPKAKIVIIFLMLLGLAGFVSRVGKQKKVTPTPSFPKKDFTAAVYTMHFGLDNYGWFSMERSAQIIENSGIDVIGLLESDASKPFHGNHDIALWLGERLNMYHDFGPSTKDHTWGNALLSKYPILKSQHILLPSPYGELAPAIKATLNVSGSLVDIVTSHMGNTEDVLDRKLQSTELSRLLGESPHPAVFIGYITSKPHSENYQRFIHEGRMKDIDPTDKGRYCEYIFYRGLQRLGYARISRGTLSDTEFQIGRFRIPENPTNYKDHETMTIDPKNAPEGVSFSSLYGGYNAKHVSGDVHRYQMGTPKFFLP